LLRILQGTPSVQRGAKFFFQLAGVNCLSQDGASICPAPGELGVVLRSVEHEEVWQTDAEGGYLHLFVGVLGDRLSLNLAGLGGVCGLPVSGKVFGTASVPFAEGGLLDGLLRFAAGTEVSPSLCRTLAAVLREGMKTREEPGISERVARALERIQRRPCDPELSVKVLAQELDCHPDYLSRRFALEVGAPLMRFVRERRMEVAADLLRGMSLPVAEVAALCGYHDHSYFSKVFRETQGLTPLEFAAARRG
jgi:AraC-like DNA-binding protein